MKRFIVFILLAISFIANAQIASDTGSLRVQINTQIVGNGTKSITATQLNNILNGITNLMKANAVDSGYRVNDTIFLTRRGFSVIKIVLNSGGTLTETDPTVPTAVKGISSTDINNWNNKQPALNTGTGISIIAGTIAARTDSALWNALKLRGNPINNTVPSVGQVLTWDGSDWGPATIIGGSQGIQNVLTVKDTISGANQQIAGVGTNNLLWMNFHNIDTRYLNRVRLFSDGGQASANFLPTVIQLIGGDSVSVAGTFGPGTGKFSVTSPTVIYSTLSLNSHVGNAGTDSLYVKGADGTVKTISPIYYGTGGSGLSSLNGLIGSSQTFAAGTSGTDFNISSTGTVHTFNFPDGSASHRGLITTTDWSTFNSKQSQLSGTGFVKFSGTTPSFDNSTYTPTSRTLNINGVSHDLSADRTFTITGTTTQSIQFAQGGSAATTYTSSTLIGQSILVIFLEGTPVDTLTKGTIYFTSDGASGTITLHNGQFAANENVIILYQSGAGGGGSGGTPATAHKIALWMGDSIMDPNTNNTLSSACSCSITPLGTSWVDTAKSILHVDSSFNYAVYGSFIEGGYMPAQKSWAAQTIQAIAQHPNADLIVVALGANDYTEMAHLGNYDSAMSRSTQAALDTTMIFEMLRYSMWRLTQSYPSARCYFITPFERKGVETESIQWLYDAIEKMAKRYNWKIIHGTEVGIVQDFEPGNISGRPGRWTIDGTHLLEPGKWLVGKFVSNNILNSFITP